MAFCQNIIKLLLLLKIAQFSDAEPYYDEAEQRIYSCNGKHVLCVGPMQYKFCFKDEDGNTFASGEAIHCPINFRCVNDGVDICVRLLSTTARPPVTGESTQIQERRKATDKTDFLSTLSKNPTDRKTEATITEASSVNMTSKTVNKTNEVSNDSDEEVNFLEHSRAASFSSTATSVSEVLTTQRTELSEFLSSTLSTESSTLAPTIIKPSVNPYIYYTESTAIASFATITPSTLMKATQESSIYNAIKQAQNLNASVVTTETTSTAIDIDNIPLGSTTENTKLGFLTRITNYHAPTLSTSEIWKERNYANKDATVQPGKKNNYLTTATAPFNRIATADTVTENKQVAVIKTTESSKATTGAFNNVRTLITEKIIFENKTLTTISTTTTQSIKPTNKSTNVQKEEPKVFTENISASQEESKQTVSNRALELIPQIVNPNHTQLQLNKTQLQNKESKLNKKPVNVNLTLQKENPENQMKPLIQTKSSLLSYWNIDWSTLQTIFKESPKRRPPIPEDSSEKDDKKFKDDEEKEDEEELNEKDKKKKILKKQKKIVKKFFKIIKNDKCDEDDIYADFKDCRKYYRCIEKSDKTRFEHLKCDDDKLFDTKKEKCVKEDEAHCFTLQDLLEEFD